MNEQANEFVHFLAHHNLEYFVYLISFEKDVLSQLISIIFYREYGTRE